MVESISGVTRSLSRDEKISLLRRNVEFLFESIVEMRQRIAILIDDNAEMDFLAAIDDRASDAREQSYLDNTRVIRQLEDEITKSRRSLLLYKEVLREQFGVDLQ